MYHIIYTDPSNPREVVKISRPSMNAIREALKELQTKTTYLPFRISKEEIIAEGVVTDEDIRLDIYK